MVTDGRVSLRATAWVELHTWLASAARTGEELGDLEPGRRAYARSLQNDDADLLLSRTTRDLASCSDDRCASAAVSPEGFGASFDRALPLFVARTWSDRAKAAWTGIEASRAAMNAIGPAADMLFTRAASDLGVAWPEHAVPVAVVSEAPPVGRDALAPVALATRGRCFVRERSTRSAPEALDHARILDCMLVHALLAAAHEAARQAGQAGPLAGTLFRELGAEQGDRAWSLLVIHSVAALIAGWEPRHRSVYRRSAEAVEAPMLEWLAKEWRGPRSAPLDAFAARYVAQWREAHAARD